MWQPLIIILLNLDPSALQRLTHNLAVIPQRIKLTRGDIRWGEIGQVFRVQRGEVGFVLSVHTGQLVELHHGGLVDDGDVLCVLRVRFVVRGVLGGDVIWV